MGSHCTSKLRLKLLSKNGSFKNSPSKPELLIDLVGLILGIDGKLGIGTIFFIVGSTGVNLGCATGAAVAGGRSSWHGLWGRFLTVGSSP